MTSEWKKENNLWIFSQNVGYPCTRRRDIEKNDIMPNNIQPNDIQPNDIQPNDIQPNDI